MTDNINQSEAKYCHKHAVEELARLSTDARYLLRCVIGAIRDAQRETPVGQSGGTLSARLRGLAESLIIMMDSGEFEDVRNAAYDLRIDPETGDLRDLAALLSMTDEQLERAEQEAGGTKTESDDTWQ